MSDEKLIEISTYKYRWHQMQVNITSRYFDFIDGLLELPMWFADSFWSVVFEGGGNLWGEYLAFLKINNTVHLFTTLGTLVHIDSKFAVFNIRGI